MKGFLNYIVDSGHSFKEVGNGIFQGDIGEINWRLFYLDGHDRKTWISLRKNGRIIAQSEELEPTIEFIEENS